MKLKLIIAAVVALILAIAAALFFGLGPSNDPGTEPGNQTVTLQDGPTGTPTEPTAVPTVDPLEAWSDDGTDAAVDMTAARLLAISTVRAYTQFDSAESAADRNARIGQLAGSEVAGGVTGLSLPKHEGSVNWSARAGVIGEPYAAFSSETETTVTFDVLAQYWGSYGTPEQNSQQAQGTWTVTIEHDGNLDAPTPVRVLTITEPDFALR